MLVAGKDALSDVQEVCMSVCGVIRLCIAQLDVGVVIFTLWIVWVLV